MGLKWLRGHRLPLTLTLIAGAGNFCEAMALSTLVLFAHDVLHLSDRGFGLLLAAMAAGGIVGSLVSSRVVSRFGGLKVAVTVQIIGPVVWLAIGVFGRDPITVVALFSVFSIALAMWNVVSASVRQRVVPSELLGRVSGACRMASYGGLPLGALVGGFVAHWTVRSLRGSSAPCSTWSWWRSPCPRWYGTGTADGRSSHRMQLPLLKCR